MSEPKECCDLVMKGGITSGVVYPLAVVELAKRYRFQNIGGTSAGAIAAAITAAAEYGRETGGFAKVAALPEELSVSLIDKFQPEPQFRALFGLLLAVLSGRPGAIAAAFLRGFGFLAALGAVPGLALALAAFVVYGAWGGLFLGLLLAITGALVVPAAAIWRQVTWDLPRADYGLCSGKTPTGARTPALTDWLADTLDRVAGLGPGEGPLTVAHLEARGITLATVTTDITSRRPYALPMNNNLHAFSESEFRRLFPDRIVTHMTGHSRPVGAGWGPDAAALYYFDMKEMPVVVLARMSLSFPGLIAAVPLHRLDHTLVDPDRRRVRCMFSDGGVSSNFPVHFFDSFLPSTPTFGIALGVQDLRRVRPGKDGRVTLPVAAGDGQLLPTQEFSGVPGFLMALFNSAKDWQDSLQSILPGYRERIATVNLTASEGGMNLDMPRETITRLSEYGQEAGRAILAEFDPDEVRWRLFLVETRALEDTLRQFARSYDRPADGPGDLSWPDLAATYKPKSFTRLSAKERALLCERAAEIATLGRSFATGPQIDEIDRRRLPTSRARIRNIARLED